MGELLAVKMSTMEYLQNNKNLSKILISDIY